MDRKGTIPKLHNGILITFIIFMFVFFLYFLINFPFTITGYAVLNIDITRSFQEISDTEGNFNEPYKDSDFFGSSVTSIGDLDNDNITDIVVGANKDDDGGTDRGAVYVLFMNTNGTVKSSQKISNTTGKFE